MDQPGEFIEHVPCPSCGSSDAGATYTDGHFFCHRCRHHEPGDGEAERAPRRAPMSAEFIPGDIQALPKRGITEETCRKFGYRVGKNRAGRTVQIAEYRDAAGEIVAQHTRTANKDFAWVGDAKSVGLFGQHLWRGQGRRIVVTEGEIDAMSVAQAFGLTWDVVSLPNGAASAKKTIQRALEFLEGYERVVLWFDADDAGRDAVAECAPLFTPGKCAVAAETGRKDANDVLREDGVKRLCQAVYDAKTYRPDGIVGLEEIEARVLAQVEAGRSWPWPKVTEATFGRRDGDVIGIGAGTGIGKTDLITQCVAHDLTDLGLTVGVIFLEQNVAETGKRVAGKIAGKRFHIPDGSWTQAELETAWGQLKATGRLHLYDAWGANSWDIIGPKVRYMVTALGCRHVYLDHMTALAAAEDDERKALERIMAEAAGMAQALGFTLHYVSHLATPDGKPHEEGGRVMIRHFKGSRALGYWSHYIFGLERDQQAATPGARSLTLFRCLKDRFTGRATGQVFPLAYDDATGILNETEMPTEGDSMRTDESVDAEF